MRTKVNVELRDAGWFVLVTEDEEIRDELGPFQRQSDAEAMATEKAKELKLL